MELRNLRKKNKKTLDDVAQDFGTSPQVISRYELGQRQLTPELLIKFAEYYDESIDYILGFKRKSADNMPADSEMIKNILNTPRIFRAIEKLSKMPKSDIDNILLFIENYKSK